jgi:hypothetical protein
MDRAARQGVQSDALMLGILFHRMNMPPRPGVVKESRNATQVGVAL